MTIASILVLKPEMILLDEPSLGLAPNFVEMIFDMIKKINEQGYEVYSLARIKYMDEYQIDFIEEN